MSEHEKFVALLKEHGVEREGYSWWVPAEPGPVHCEDAVDAVRALLRLADNDVERLERERDEAVRRGRPIWFHGQRRIAELEAALTRCEKGYRNLVELGLLRGTYAEEAAEIADEAERALLSAPELAAPLIAHPERFIEINCDTTAAPEGGHA